MIPYADKIQELLFLFSFKEHFPMKRLIFPGERTVNLKMIEIVISEAKKLALFQ
jgi:hypothetical protein